MYVRRHKDALKSLHVDAVLQAKYYRMSSSLSSSHSLWKPCNSKMAHKNVEVLKIICIR